VSSALAAFDQAFDQVPYHRVKRAVDLFGSVVLLITAAPLFLAVGLLVAADVGLPLVFWQQRPGLRGRPFKLYKFLATAPNLSPAVLWQRPTDLMVNGNPTTRGFQASAISFGGVV
jgi:lipopolysaccharide/colanic/teichoic acid biosynthesis glycosyltransferase